MLCLKKKKKKLRYVNYVNDEITEMHADEEDLKAYKRNLKVNVKFFFTAFQSLGSRVVCITIESWFIHIAQVSHKNSLVSDNWVEALYVQKKSSKWDVLKKMLWKFQNPWTGTMLSVVTNKQ